MTPAAVRKMKNAYVPPSPRMPGPVPSKELCYGAGDKLSAVSAETLIALKSTTGNGTGWLLVHLR